LGDRHRSILPVPVVCEELSAQSDYIGAVPGASHIAEDRLRQLFSNARHEIAWFARDHAH